jgi:hypothetical protein
MRSLQVALTVACDDEPFLSSRQRPLGGARQRRNRGRQWRRLGTTRSAWHIDRGVARRDLGDV